GLRRPHGRAPAADDPEPLKAGIGPMNQPRPDEPSSAEPFPAYLDPLCSRFEAACKAAAPGEPLPRPEDYLGETPPPDRVPLLRELVALELAYCRQRGETPDAAAYRARFPDVDPAWIEREIQRGSPEPREAPAAVAPEGIPRTQAQQIRCPHCHNPIQLVDD